MEKVNTIRLTVLAVIIPILFLSSCSKKQNWPQFKGPDGNMIIAGANLPEEWGNDKNVLWIDQLDGTGFSSPIISGNNVYITSAFPEKVNPVPERGPMQGPPPGGGQGPQPGQPGQGPQPGQAPPRPQVQDTSYKTEIYRWELICIDLKTGKENWRQVAYHGIPNAAKNPMSTYACETPVTDGKRVIAHFGMNGLFCYNTEGKLLWEKDMGVYYTLNGWGTGSSPVIYKDVLYIQFDNEENSFIVALNAETGNEIWRVTRDEKTTYSTPYIWKNKVRTELVTCGITARSYDPETGKLLWELTTGGEMVIPSPTGNEELLFIGNAGGRETKGILFAVKAGTNGEIAWQSEESGLANPSTLLYKGFLYIIGSRGEIAVLDAASGELKYQKRISGIGSCWASPWAYYDRIYFLDENGMTRAFKAGESIEIVSENKLEGSKFWSSVAATGNAYIFRGAEKLYCVGK